MSSTFWQDLVVGTVAAISSLSICTAELAIEKRLKRKWLMWLPSEILVFAPLSYFCISHDVGWIATSAMFSEVVVCQTLVGYRIAHLIDPGEYEYPAGPLRAIHLKLALSSLAVGATYAFFVFQAVWIPMLLRHRT